MHYETRRVGDTVDILGESPIWCPREQALYWIDIRKPAVRRRDHQSGETENWPMPELVGSMALCEKGGMILALRSSVSLFDPRTGEMRRVAAPHAGEENMRFNDGKCDRQGRFWAGSMNDVTRAPVGTLYRLGADGTTEPVVPGIRVPNSLCWSPDGRRMYFGDTDERAIYEYPFDPQNGEVGTRKVFARIETPQSGPDGATVDEHGFVWCAIYGAGKIIRYAPSGEIDQEIRLPVSQPTSCAFGGPGLDRLYVTTASQRLSDEELAKQPLAGALLEIEVGVRGLPEPRFGGGVEA